MLAGVFPGQGSQSKGMGGELFNAFRALTEHADQILGYSVRELCLQDEGNRLRLTQYAQPALFVVSALSFLAREKECAPRYLAGHSLGEYAALFAAGCFDFETGLRLVQKRGELMGRSNGGAMVAVLGAAVEEVQRHMLRNNVQGVDVANYNGPTQLVLSGMPDAIAAATEEIERGLNAKCIPLRVSAPFHSRYMEEAAREFSKFVAEVRFADPRIPVISNVTAEPYVQGAVSDLLVQQIRQPVRWLETMRLLRDQGVREVEEFGPGNVLSVLWKSFAREPLRPSAAVAKPESSRAPMVNRGAGHLAAEALGSEEFRRDYGLRYAYLAGAMYCGIASTELVLRAGRAGLMGFFGAGGIKLDEVEAAIRVFQTELGPEGRYGMNLLYSLEDEGLEESTVALYLRHKVRFVEAAGYMQITPALVHYRFAGCHRGEGGRPVALQHVLAKVSRPEVASAFMRPPSDALLKRLVLEGKLTSHEAELAAQLPLSEDICVESDSGGHTDGGVALALFPSIRRLRDDAMERHGYRKSIRVGAAGGLGTPAAVAAAFILGADFVLTGSVNQCSPEAGTSATVKDMLTGLDVQDTAYAPSGSLLELGARVQVVRKGTLFPGRANKLEQIYHQHESLQQIDKRTRAILEDSYFKRSFEQVWRETCAHLERNKPDQIILAEQKPKRKMALLFKWYFAHTARAAIQGVTEEKANFQIHCGPAMGAFNHFVRGTDLEDWRMRHVDVIAERLMQGAAGVLSSALRHESAPSSRQIQGVVESLV